MFKHTTRTIRMTGKAGKALESVSDSVSGIFDKMNGIFDEAFADDEDEDEDESCAGTSCMSIGSLGITSSNGHVEITGPLKSLKVNGVGIDIDTKGKP